MAWIYGGKVANSESGRKTGLIGCFNCFNWSILNQVFRELSSAKNTNLKIANFCQCANLWWSDMERIEFAFNLITWVKC